MTDFTFQAADLEKCFAEIEKLLFDKSSIHAIEYSNANDTELNYSENNKTLIDAIKGEPAIYCIWVKQASQREFTPAYVGHAKEPRDRMREHLSKKDERTGSCLEQVKRALQENGTIGITFVKIKPPYMRTAVEEWLIGRNSDALPWNSHGR